MQMMPIGYVYTKEYSAQVEDRDRIIPRLNSIIPCCPKPALPNGESLWHLLKRSNYHATSTRFHIAR